MNAERDSAVGEQPSIEALNTGKSDKSSSRVTSGRKPAGRGSGASRSTVGKAAAGETAAQAPAKTSAKAPAGKKAAAPKKTTAKRTAVKTTTAKRTATKTTAAAPKSAKAAAAKTPAAKAPARKPESRAAMIRRARRINRELAEVYPYAHPELDFTNPFELLVATVLSAQTTDLRVNQTTPALFALCPTPEDMAAMDPERLEELIRPAGFFRAKTKSLLGLSAALRDRFGGEVPGRLEDLVSLPGVGRKTANVVLGNAFGFAT